MEEKLKSLTEILRKEISLYERLLRLCRREKAVVIKGDLRELEKITREQETLFLELREWERARGVVMENLKKLVPLSGKLSLSKLAKVVKEPFASQIESLQKRAISLMKEIDQANKTNISLLSYSVKLIDECLALLTETKEVPIYDQSGRSGKREQGRKLLDQKT